VKLEYGGGGFLLSIGYTENCDSKITSIPQKA
jgi:hypothetical protein